jgi:sarcosine oxidase delta subunit
LCPHCGEKPGYFFHVRSCAKKKNKNDGDDRNRDPGGN